MILNTGRSKIKHTQKLIGCYSWKSWPADHLSHQRYKLVTILNLDNIYLSGPVNIQHFHLY